jgi:hypothetical protein
MGNQKTVSWELGQWTEGSCSGNEIRTGVPVSYRVATHKRVAVWPVQSKDSNLGDREKVECQ